MFDINVTPDFTPPSALKRVPGLTWQEQDGQVWAVATDVNGEQVGCAAMVVAGNTARIKTVAVLPDVRGQGLFGRMLDTLLDNGKAQGVTKFTCFSSEMSRGGFTRAGFETKSVSRQGIAYMVLHITHVKDWGTWL